MVEEIKKPKLNLEIKEGKFVRYLEVLTIFTWELYCKIGLQTIHSIFTK
jgi:hypothetical protein